MSRKNKNPQFGASVRDPFTGMTLNAPVKTIGRVRAPVQSIGRVAAPVATTVALQLSPVTPYHPTVQLVSGATLAPKASAYTPSYDNAVGAATPVVKSIGRVKLPDLPAESVTIDKVSNSAAAVSASIAPSYPTTNSSGSGGGSSGGGGSGSSTYEETPDPTAYSSTEDSWSPPTPSRLMAQTQNTSRPLSAPLPVITPSTTKGLFRRIWDFFFGSPTPTKISGELEDAAESLVKRARMGDQNAVAMIARVRENRLSVSAAAKSYKLIEAYIARHPTGGSDTRIRVTQMNGDPRMTRTQGIIKRLALMQRGSRVSDYDPMVGWELGE